MMANIAAMNTFGALPLRFKTSFVSGKAFLRRLFLSLTYPDRKDTSMMFLDILLISLSLLALVAFGLFITVFFML